ncbi:M99 family carboxypeptidase catalytic domain-containing protein [Helicobacter cetorum]|uniref:M99 family carboxypeptidase catalytic domain-containing protein n=1 Tax=Helicobacter cetorum TaxID=138563 RepID=UPI000CF07F4F|nr:M99 family carboxypeptidase catalytic domain-containing protein [Helicobacter cetorum]
MKMFWRLIIGISLSVSFFACLNALEKPHLIYDITPIEKVPKNLEDKDKAPHLLLLGGIQGDEPGGFNATNLFLKHYTILKGSVKVVPVLNKHSMLRNHRGLYDDMNRKFAHLDKNDPEYPIIQHVKSLISEPNIDAILHLHDGSGYYRPIYIDSMLNPKRWGNCFIIDQEEVKGAKFPNLLSVATHTIANINAHLLRPIEEYHLRNTHTAKGDREMEKALTFYAIKQKKSAFANEASKELPLKTRVFYHLQAIEGLLNQLNIPFKRDFELNPNSVHALINDKSLWAKIDSLPKMQIFNLRPKLNHFPLPKNTNISDISIESNAYIVGLVENKQEVFLKYGNKLMTRLSPFYTEFDNSLKEVKMRIDNSERLVKIGSVIEVKKSFYIHAIENMRANVIGFSATKESKPNEVGYTIELKDFQKRFSLDKQEKIYRIEFYKDNAFSGMILVRFV